MSIHRIKHTFTAGELSPLMGARMDFDRYKNGCLRLRNTTCATQGPAVRRPGTKFIYDLNRLGLNTLNPEIRLIPFIFNELQAYVMIFFMHTDGFPRVVFGYRDGLVVGSGNEDCSSINYESIPFTGAGDYDSNLFVSSVNDIRVQHRATDGEVVLLTTPADYILTINDPLPNTLVVTWDVKSGGALEVFPTGVAAGEVVALKLPTGWDIKKFDWAQSADEMYFAQSGLAPHVIRRYDHDCWELLLITFTDQPADWGPLDPGTGSPIIEQGWPERVTFHQQRLAYATTLLRRQTIWLSKAGNFHDFGVDLSNLADDDAVTFTLDSGTQNKIQWMVSSKALNVGTMGNEWTVTGATQNALTPKNILAQRQTNNGGEALKPLMVGITTLFVERHGRVVNEFVYDYTYDSYKTSDLAILSPHITEHYSIIDWSYQQTPDSIIWCVREDGELAAITYQRQHKVIGWHTHDTDGKFKAITVIPGETREDDVWTVVHRVIGTTDHYYLEKFEDQFKSESAEWGRFLDSHLVYQGIAVDRISGLGHLEGKEVHILANGTVHPPLVVLGGAIVLNTNYSHVVIGLQYISEIRPLLADLPLQDGTAFGRVQRVTNVDIDFYRSLGIYLGRDDTTDGEHEEEHAFRIPGDLMGQQVPLFTGIKHIDFPEGFDRKAEYFIRQYQPLPLTVRGVVDTIEAFE